MVRSRPRSKSAFALIEIVVVGVTTAVLSGASYGGYEYFTEKSEQAVVDAHAAQMAKQLCASTVLTGVGLNEYNESLLGSVRENLATIGSEHVAIHPSSGANILVKGSVEAPSGWALIQDGDNQASFSLDARTCRALKDAANILTSAPAPNPSTQATAAADASSAPTPTPTPTSEPTPTASKTPVLPDPAGPAGAGVPGLLDRAIYSWSSIAGTNDFHLSQGSAAAAIYTTGEFTCDSDTHIDAYVHTTAGASLTNDCYVKGIWAQEDIRITTRTPVIDGPATSSTGSMYSSNNPTVIAGDVTLAGAFHRTDGKAANIGGNLRENTEGIKSVPVLPFPQLPESTSVAHAGVTWAAVAKASAKANKAPTWVLTSDLCSISNANWSINGPLTLPATDTIIDATSCPTLTWNGSAGANHIKISADTTILVNNFSNSGALNVTSTDGAVHELRIIVAWKNTSASECTQSGSGSIAFAAGGVNIDPLVPTLLYTPGTITLSNNMTFTGQMYGCSVKLANNVHMSYRPVWVG